MDLKTFLLARIAEDEERAEVCKAMGWVPAKKYGITVTHPTRVLAECAAKREIVEYWAVDETLVRLLNVLAAVYADHPDYQPEWKLAE